MKYPDEIQTVISKKGGVVKYEELSPGISQNLLYYRNRAQTSVKLINDQLRTNIQVEIIDDFGFNAFATGLNGFYFIGINRGVIATLSLVFNRIFADQNLFKFIGKYEIEESDLPLLEDLSVNFEFTVDKLTPFNPPKDPFRKSTSRHLVHLAIDFILAHEIGHIIRGHIDYIQNSFNLVHNEIDNIGTEDNLYPLTNKTLEMDADCWAVNMLLKNELNRVFGILPIPGPEWKEIYMMPGIVIMQFTFAIATVFRIYGDQRLDESGFGNEIYPKPRLRFVISMLELAKNKNFLNLNDKMKFDLNEKGVPKIVLPAFDMIEEAFNSITGKNSNKLSIEDAWGTIGIQQINTLFEFWNRHLSHILQAYSNITLFQLNKI